MFLDFGVPFNLCWFSQRTDPFGSQSLQIDFVLSLVSATDLKKFHHFLCSKQISWICCKHLSCYVVYNMSVVIHLCHRRVQWIVVLEARWALAVQRCGRITWQNSIWWNLQILLIFLNFSRLQASSAMNGSTRPDNFIAKYIVVKHSSHFSWEAVHKARMLWTLWIFNIHSSSGFFMFFFLRIFSHHIFTHFLRYSRQEIMDMKSYPLSNATIWEWQHTISLGWDSKSGPCFSF